MNEQNDGCNESYLHRSAYKVTANMMTHSIVRHCHLRLLDPLSLSFENIGVFTFAACLI